MGNEMGEAVEFSKGAARGGGGNPALAVRGLRARAGLVDAIGAGCATAQLRGAAALFA